MNLKENFSLKNLNTFGVSARAKWFLCYENLAQLREFLASDLARENEIFHIGGGSNLLFLGDFGGVVLKSEISDFEILEENENDVLVRVGAGWTFDDFVEKCVEKGWGGVENLSAIPGQVGASAVQNIGAYGVEASSAIEAVEFLDFEDLEIKILKNSECKFGYRASIFKQKKRGSFAITHVQFRLQKTPKFALDYAAVREKVESFGEVNLKNVRKAICEIRAEKLPDVKDFGSAGSFFMNPIVNAEKFAELQNRFPKMPFFSAPDGGVKLSSGWLIEQCGFKGKRRGNVGVYEKQALILVNFGGASGKEIADFSAEICQKVFEKFNVKISPEVIFI